MNIKMHKTKNRRIYLFLFPALLFIEMIIALFVHDRFIRPYMGDILVVAVIYCLVRIFLPVGVKLLPLYVFAFAVLIEVLQSMDFASILGLENNRLFRIAFGSTFDMLDIVCYAVGCAILGMVEIGKLRIKHEMRD